MALTQLRPYRPIPLSGGDIRLQPLKLTSDVLTKGIPAFEENIFKKKHLFSQSAKKKAEEKKPEFILLGVSVGDKNLAMIRDVNGNKDYYCLEGESIGNFRVKQVFKNKVILESEGKILEIRQ